MSTDTSGSSSSSSQRVALVTGAGSGIGASLAVALAADALDVVLVGRRRERLERTAELAREKSGKSPLILAADVTRPGAARSIVGALYERHGRLDVLVNNAALSRFGSLGSTTEADDREIFDTNVLAPLALIRAARPLLEACRGVVVNIGSIGGILSLPNRAAYGASKAALHHLTRSLAKELAPHVRVNAVLPGPVDGEVYENLGISPEQTVTLRTELMATTALGRMGQPSDIVPWIAMLLGPAGAWVTGSLLVVDGGRSC
jgi:NAD(P)-dependent dehydrogenase (short-subunit alcohol dehydrogenase family)